MKVATVWSGLAHYASTRKDLHTSRLKSTPPIGEPKATEIPDAAAADKTSLLRALRYVSRVISDKEVNIYLHWHSESVIASSGGWRSSKQHEQAALPFLTISRMRQQGTSRAI